MPAPAADRVILDDRPGEKTLKDADKGGGAILRVELKQAIEELKRVREQAGKK
jgi:hypothetical protein